MEPRASSLPEGYPLNPMLHPPIPDPYPLYSYLRDHEPLHQPYPGVWVVSKFDDLVFLTAPENVRKLSNSLVNSVVAKEMRGSEGEGMAPVSGREALAYIDPPAHTRMRAKIAPAFANSRVQALRPLLERACGRLISERRDPSHLEIIQEYASPLAITATCALLGIEVRDINMFVQWARDLALAFDPLITPEVQQQVERTRADASAYFLELAKQRRRQPSEDIVSELVAGDDPLADDELIAACVNLIVAGHETTTSSIANAVLTLLTRPDQLDALRAAPNLMRSAVDELLRFESPVQFLGRAVLDGFDLRGERIRVGDQVIGIVGAANRDAAAFANAERLDVRAGRRHHFAFGGGIHYCIGAGLARLEEEVALRTLIASFDQFTLSDEPLEWTAPITLRSLRALRIAVRGQRPYSAL